MAKGTQYFKFNGRRQAPVDQTAKEFLESIGSATQISTLLAFSGMPTTAGIVKAWKVDGTIPEQAYTALKTLRDEGMRQSIQANAEDEHISGLEIFYNGLFIGRFDLPRGIKVVAKKKGFKL